MRSYQPSSLRTRKETPPLYLKETLRSPFFLRSASPIQIRRISCHSRECDRMSSGGLCHQETGKFPGGPKHVMIIWAYYPKTNFIIYLYLNLFFLFLKILFITYLTFYMLLYVIHVHHYHGRAYIRDYYLCIKITLVIFMICSVLSQ